MQENSSTNAANGSRDMLLKEVKYRASYRGMLELDLVCRSILPHLDEMSDEELAAVAGLLLQRETELLSWLVEGGKPLEEFELVVGLVRHYFRLSKHSHP